MIRQLLLSLIVAVCAFAPALRAQNCNPETSSACTAQEAIDFYRRTALERLGITVTDAAQATEIAVTETDEEVTNTNRATTAPDAFAGRVHNSYEDFLNLFSFAINKVDESEDGQALTVRFNPLRSGKSLFGLTLTAAKPGIAESVRNAIPETGRSDVVTQLEKQIDDLDDLTIAGSYSLQTVRCPWDKPTERCYGRTAETYRDILGHALAPLFAKSPVVEEERQQALKQLVRTFVPPQKFQENPNLDIFSIPIRETTDAESFRRALKEFSELQAQQTFDEKTFFDKQNLDVLATLVDNQPQVSFTGTYHSPGKLGGPNQTALTVELQVGNDNMNKLRSQCTTATDECVNKALLAKLEKGASSVKWVLTGTYTRNDGFKVTATDLPLDSPVDGFMPVDEKSSSELKVKGQGGVVLGAAVGTENARADFALEGHRVENDRTRTTNRWVASATLTVPLGENMSVPLTVTYANKAEFLGDQDKNFGVHLGLSYRLPMRKSTDD